MFLFGGKKEKKKGTEEKKPKLPKSVVSAIASFHASTNKGYIKLVAEADPERNENRVMKILDAEQKYREGYISPHCAKKISKCGYARKI